MLKVLVEGLGGGLPSEGLAGRVLRARATAARSSALALGLGRQLVGALTKRSAAGGHPT